MPRLRALVRVVFAFVFFGLSLALSAARVAAQVPQPNGPTGARRVHPTIANPAPGLPLVGSPHFAVDDGVWNHGEGLAGADSGGWHANDDGTNVTIADVHWNPLAPAWSSFTWTDAFHLSSGASMLRHEGWLRPGNLALPNVHPLYGALPPNSGPFGNGTYVDQGAFELFRPVAGPAPTQKILICIECQSSALFPQDRNRQRLAWHQVYRGIFSPDGLVRDEPLNQPRTLATFLGNTDDNAVERPILNIIATWASGDPFWPIVGYPVLSVMHRQTTLNEQRQLQLVQAIKCLLQENSLRNPLGPGNQLTPQQVEARVVVCFTGGSNGGLQSQLAALRHPHLVHGAFAVAINPSLQRFYGEHDLGHALARLSGAGAFYGAGIGPPDFLHWNQYPWSAGLEMHDLSVLRHFVAGTSYRPMCFTVGDEDITSTGTDWAKVIDGAQWSDHGTRQSSSGFGSATNHRFGWMVAENACHDNQAPVTNAYNGAPDQYAYYDIAHHTFVDAMTHRTAELANPQPIGPPTHERRSAAQQLRGLDDPQEWFLGRGAQSIDEATGTPSGVLLRDDAWRNAVQPHTAGTQPGRREAMLIRDGFVYVGSAEGIVSKFHVVPATTDPKQPLVRDAQSEKLGHEAFALAAFDDGASWSLVVGTRRHLYRLDPGTLAVQAGPKELPWEVAQPHHMRVADVLPGHPGKEIVFATIHGGLCFYDPGLGSNSALFEWPEPGIADFAVDAGAVTILSYRGMLATVSFDANNVATLHAASSWFPTWESYNASQGVPQDLELMRVNWSAYGAGVNTAAISLWTGDIDGPAVRGHWKTTLLRAPYLQNLADGAADIATCLEGPSGNDGTLGDHVLVLGINNQLSLYDQYGQLHGRKVLTTTTQGYYPFAAGAHTVAVGELVSSGSPGPYDQEVVVATPTGLMWLHVNDLLGPGIELPASGTSQGTYTSGYFVETVRSYTGPGSPETTHVQPRTNQNLAAAWAIARRPVTGDNDLHVLDPRGAYWRVGANGRVTLWERDHFLLGARGWGFVGAVSSGFPSGSPNLSVDPVPTSVVKSVTTNHWCPRETTDLVYENTPRYKPNNWSRRNLPKPVFEGFLVHGAGGHVLTTASGREAWFWTHVPQNVLLGLHPWGNLVEGLSFTSTGAINGVWASTGRPVTVTPAPNEVGDKGVFHILRSYVSDIPIMSQQAVRAVKLTHAPFAGGTAVVLGRPGGRVGVLLPGAMRTTDATSPAGDHVLGPNPADESADLGYGVSALAVRHEPGPPEQVRIWCGTVSHPSNRPAAYASASASLGLDEGATGAVHQLVWTPGTPGTFTSVGAPLAFHPTTPGSRGAYGVVGLLLSDLLPGSPGDELVVATLSGDLLVLNAATMVELWRTHLPGAVGLYNSMLAEDLDGENGKELYVAGSWGLWRFTLAQP